jgi:hypothetical protein
MAVGTGTEMASPSDPQFRPFGAARVRRPFPYLPGQMSYPNRPLLWLNAAHIFSP